MLRAKLIPMVLLMAMSLVIACGVPTTPTATPAEAFPDRVDLSRVKEAAVRALLDSEGNVIDHNSRLASIAKDHEGGFGGWYFSEDKGTVYVFMMDTTKVKAAREAFRAAYTGQYDSANINIEVVEGTYSLDDLVDWANRLTVSLLEAGALWKSMSIDHANNVISLRFVSADRLETAGQVRERLGIPEGAVLFTEIGESRLMDDGEGLDEEWRPLVGRVQSWTTLQ